ncbi:MAG: GNAT family N-acetyltransferase [Rhodospirillales bacterium]|nr:MAG: GNAT family N-acetyltransferase [Rhodospirillales bacterium]
MPARPSNDPPLIRRAGPGDAAAIAALHLSSWRDVYRGILPDSYLDGPAPRERQEYWASVLAATSGGLVLAAASAREIVGFIAVSCGGEPGYDAVIDSLHVARSARGAGLGRRLMGRAAALLLADGLQSVCLRVYDANRAALRFYRRLGGRPDGSGIDPFAGADMPDTRLGWPDLGVLHAACIAGS